MNTTSEKILQSFYAYFIYILTLFISGCIVNTLQCILHHTLKRINKYMFRKINYYFCYTLYTQLMFLAEWFAGAQIILYVDQNDFVKYIGKEHAYIISNHKYEIDWLLLGLLAEKVHCAGNFKAFMKKLIQYVPAIGWGLYFSDNIFLQRSFEKDKKIIQEQISTLVDYSDPIWLLLYPEGTRFTPEKYKAALQIAKEKGLPELTHLLTPRTKGFISSLAPMRNKMPALYDITVAFDPNDKEKPTMRNIFMGEEMHVHIYLRRIPFHEIPLDEKEATVFLHNIFARKDKLLGSFLQTRDYFTNSGIEKLDKIIFKRSLSILLNILFWHVITMTPLFYYLIRMLFTASIYYICLVYGSLFLASYILSKMFSVSEVKKASSYGIEAQKKK